MKTLRFGLIWNVLQVIIILVSGSSGAKVQLYGDNHYFRLLLEVSLNDECYDIPSDKWSHHRSVITDTCVIIYHNSNCKSAYSRKYMPGNTAYEAWGFPRSLQKCNDQEGGPKLNIDITTVFIPTEPPRFPNILESYYDVCRCINVPQYVKDMSAWAIDNHANGLFAYFEPDCREQHSNAKYIEAGHYVNSWNMQTHLSSYRGSPMKIKSIGPAQNSTYFQQSCSSYQNDKIMKLELLEAVNSSGAHIILNSNPAPTNLISGANDDPMHFFVDNDYQGFRFGSRSTSKCYNFPITVQRRMKNKVGSIKTNTCMILYSEVNCAGRSVKIEAPGNSNLTSVWESTVTSERTLSLLYTQYPNFKWETKSYHACNKDRAGPSLNVEINSDDPIAREKDGFKILENYKKVCSCRNIPEYIQQLDSWSINNNGNALIAYFSADCLSTTHSPLWIPSGQSSYSLGLGRFKKEDYSTGVTHKIQSFGPDPNAEYFRIHCNPNLTALIDGSMCDVATKDKSTQTGLLILERMQTQKAKLQERLNEFQIFSQQVDDLGPIHEEAALNLEIAKNDFKAKMIEQNDGIQEIIDIFKFLIHKD